MTTQKLQIHRGPISWLDIGYILQDGEPFMADVPIIASTDGDLLELLWFGSIDGNNHLVGGGLQAVSSIPTFPAPNGALCAFNGTAYICWNNIWTPLGKGTGDIVLQLTNGQPTDIAIAGTLRADPYHNLMWLSLGYAGWSAYCPCAGSGSGVGTSTGISTGGGSNGGGGGNGGNGDHTNMVLTPACGWIPDTLNVAITLGWSGGSNTSTINAKFKANISTQGTFNDYSLISVTPATNPQAGNKFSDGTTVIGDTITLATSLINVRGYFPHYVIINGEQVLDKYVTQWDSTSTSMILGNTIATPSKWYILLSFQDNTPVQPNYEDIQQPRAAYSVLPPLLNTDPTAPYEEGPPNITNCNPLDLIWGIYDASPPIVKMQFYKEVSGYVDNPPTPPVVDIISYELEIISVEVTK